MLVTCEDGLGAAKVRALLDSIDGKYGTPRKKSVLNGVRTTKKRQNTLRYELFCPTYERSKRFCPSMLDSFNDARFIKSNRSMSALASLILLAYPFMLWNKQWGIVRSDTRSCSELWNAVVELYFMQHYYSCIWLLNDRLVLSDAVHHFEGYSSWFVAATGAITLTMHKDVDTR